MEERLIKVGITQGDIKDLFRYPHGGALHADYLWLVQDSRLSPEGIGASSYQYEYYFACGGCRSKPGEHY